MSPASGAILAGPILRHVAADRFTLWLVTRSEPAMRLSLFDDQETSYFDAALRDDQLTRVRVGTSCVVNLIQVQPETLPERRLLYYDLALTLEEGTYGLKDLTPELLYEGQKTPVFCYNPTIKKLLHGSCRKPHHPERDAMSAVDHVLARDLEDAEARPSMMLFTGDQIYADDVAGPMLLAIHKLMDTLGLFGETWAGDGVSDSEALLDSPHCYYERQQLLPKDRDTRALLDVLFRGARKPVFTTVNAANHLVTYSEMLSMYLLVWSPRPWTLIEGWDDQGAVDAKHRPRFVEQLAVIKPFVEDLAKAARVLAHLPTYMIFDDHDVTDDWNLTRGWEETAYGNPFSKRIIGNALTSYWLCQGWGNLPENLQDLTEDLLPHFGEDGITDHDELVEKVLDWRHWHYHLATEPKLIVLDTRTRRWRSESSASQPSGLMDWESLSELQQELLDEPAVIVVSAAPIFGVKLIETMQRVMTFFGQALMVDAENWMAHPGAANVILNIFRHPRTPPKFIILSGDVHYSFAFNVTLRSRRSHSRIMQITASGIKNSFPAGLLRWFAGLDRLFFGHRSPLNWLTKRRSMRIRARKVSEGDMHALLNHSGMGVVELEGEAKQVHASVLCSDGRFAGFR